MRVTQPFDFSQGHELVEWQMGVFRQPQQKSAPKHPSKEEKREGGRGAGGSVILGEICIVISR
jgi:hypothetical protein